MSALITTRRRFLKFAAGAGAFGAVAVAGEATLFEPNHPHIVRLDMPLRRWPQRLDGFTIALLSDFHFDPYFSVHPLRAAVPMVNGLHPDLIVMTGDFVTAPVVGDGSKGYADAAGPCADLLIGMHAPHGLWAVMGNHDCHTSRRQVTGELEARGIHVLANQSTPIEMEGARFWLSGTNDVISGKADLGEALQSVPENEAVVLLVHEPDFADTVVGFPVDLQLSGHSHGGQIRLPLLGPLYLPEWGKKYVRGLFHIGPLTLYTNVGIGTVGLAMPLGCPPEITLLTLRSSGGGQ